MRLVVILALILAIAVGSAWAAVPASITVTIKQPVERVTLKLVPDFALMMTFDRPIAAVAIGDDTLVATAVRESALVYFDTEGLQVHPDLLPVAVLLITDLVWRRVQAHPERRKLVVFDEVWTLLTDQTAGPFIEELYRRFRKFGAAVLSISQSPADFADSPYAAGILANTQYRYLLRVKDPDEAARVLGLGDRQRDLLATLAQEKGRYSEALALVDFAHGRDGGVLVVRPSSMDYWIATTDPTDVQFRQAQIQACGDVWTAIQRLATESPKGLEAGGHTVYDR